MDTQHVNTISVLQYACKVFRAYDHELNLSEVSNQSIAFVEEGAWTRPYLSFSSPMACVRVYVDNDFVWKNDKSEIWTKTSVRVLMWYERSEEFTHSDKIQKSVDNLSAMFNFMKVLETTLVECPEINEQFFMTASDFYAVRNIDIKTIK